MAETIYLITTDGPNRQKITRAFTEWEKAARYANKETQNALMERHEIALLVEVVQTE